MPAPSADPDTPRRGQSFPGLADFRTAVHSLTILGPRLAHSTIGVSAIYYPAVGLLLGAAWVATDRAAILVGDRLVASSLVLLVAALLTGAQPLLGLSRTMASLASGRSRQGVLAIMQGPPTRTVYVCLILVSALELVCVYELDRFRLVALLFAPILARCSMVVLAVGSRGARSDGRRVKFAPDTTFREFAVASTLTFAVIFIATESLGLVLVLATAALIIGLRSLFHRWLDGINDTVMDATCELTQLVTLAILALF